ncbi:hypothetical protein PtA15_7A354 [Puccinia triticina]|uniref:Uncharacterized protein n=1 Tax=Puccinia triticina TaxID=208348 RepID=A0ABY7CRN7_9BASI|nr:uncharacterized protein PtA15_7A354 [Puccinia triticina]WAQ86627.1 hypothetical protein PtA15_7A354 [Puccinia triticina]WAR56488.1 hypothetical protein PtB15_7B337 [Puccinia triticina]
MIGFGGSWAGPENPCPAQPIPSPTSCSIWTVLASNLLHSQSLRWTALQPPQLQITPMAGSLSNSKSLR